MVMVAQTNQVKSRSSPTTIQWVIKLHFTAHQVTQWNPSDDLVTNTMLVQCPVIRSNLQVLPTFVFLVTCPTMSSLQTIYNHWHSIKDEIWFLYLPFPNYYTQSLWFSSWGHRELNCRINTDIVYAYAQTWLNFTWIHVTFATIINMSVKNLDY